MTDRFKVDENKPWFTKEADGGRGSKELSLTIALCTGAEESVKKFGGRRPYGSALDAR